MVALEERLPRAHAAVGVVARVRLLVPRPHLGDHRGAVGVHRLVVLPLRPRREVAHVRDAAAHPPQHLQTEPRLPRPQLVGVDQRLPPLPHVLAAQLRGVAGAAVARLLDRKQTEPLLIHEEVGLRPRRVAARRVEELVLVGAHLVHQLVARVAPRRVDHASLPHLVDPRHQRAARRRRHLALRADARGRVLLEILDQGEQPLGLHRVLGGAHDEAPLLVVAELVHVVLVAADVLRRVGVGVVRVDPKLGDDERPVRHLGVRLEEVERVLRAKHHLRVHRVREVLAGVHVHRPEVDVHQDRVEHRDPAERAEERRARPRLVPELANGNAAWGSCSKSRRRTACTGSRPT